MKQRNAQKKMLFVVITCIIACAILTLSHKTIFIFFKSVYESFTTNENSHNMLDDIVINENGYTLMFKDIFIDSDRIEMLITLIDNNKIGYKYIYDNKIAEEYTMMEKYSVTKDKNLEVNNKYLGLSVNIIGFEGKISFTGSEAHNRNYNIKRLRCNFSQSFLKDYLQNKHGYLEVEAHVYNENQEILYNFHNINITFDKNKILEP